MTLVIALMLIAGLDLSYWWYPLVLLAWLMHVGFWNNMVNHAVKMGMAIVVNVAEGRLPEDTSK